MKRLFLLFLSFSLHATENCAPKVTPETPFSKVAKRALEKGMIDVSVIDEILAANALYNPVKRQRLRADEIPVRNGFDTALGTQRKLEIEHQALRAVRAAFAGEHLARQEAKRHTRRVIAPEVITDFANPFGDLVPDISWHHNRELGDFLLMYEPERLTFELYTPYAERPFLRRYFGRDTLAAPEQGHFKSKSLETRDGRLFLAAEVRLADGEHSEVVVHEIFKNRTFRVPAVTDNLISYEIFEDAAGQVDLILFARETDVRVYRLGAERFVFLRSIRVNVDRLKKLWFANQPLLLSEVVEETLLLYSPAETAEPVERWTIASPLPSEKNYPLKYSLHRTAAGRYMAAVAYGKSSDTIRFYFADGSPSLESPVGVLIGIDDSGWLEKDGRVFFAALPEDSRQVLIYEPSNPALIEKGTTWRDFLRWPEWARVPNRPPPPRQIRPNLVLTGSLKAMEGQPFLRGEWTFHEGRTLYVRSVVRSLEVFEPFKTENPLAEPYGTSDLQPYQLATLSGDVDRLLAVFFTPQKAALSMVDLLAFPAQPLSVSGTRAGDYFCNKMSPVFRLQDGGWVMSEVYSHEKLYYFRTVRFDREIE